MNLISIVKKEWDRTAALLLTIVGATMLISGWVGVSGTAELSDQAAFIVSGGLGGIFLLGVAATLWISADLRDEWRKLDRIEKALGEGVLRWDGGTAPQRSTVVSMHASNGSRPHVGEPSDA